MPSGRGSCSGTGTILEMLLNGTAPAALIPRRDRPRDAPAVATSSRSAVRLHAHNAPFHQQRDEECIDTHQAGDPHVYQANLPALALALAERGVGDSDLLANGARTPIKAQSALDSLAAERQEYRQV